MTTVQNTIAGLTTTIIIIGLLSCDRPSQDTFRTQENTIIIDSVIATDNNIPTDTQIETDTLIRGTDSAIILGQLYKAIYKTDDILYVLNSTGDTILKEHDLFLTGMDFEDFDGDGLKDLLAHIIGNVPSPVLFLFDKQQRIFKRVEDFSNYPEALPIKGTIYYYSYHRSGCADANWDSDLFYINNYKTYRIGNIYGSGCNDRDVKDGVYIHKVKDDKEILFQTLPIDTLESYADYKWGFIKDYWTKNYSKFIN